LRFVASDEHRIESPTPRLHRFERRQIRARKIFLISPVQMVLRARIAPLGEKVLPRVAR